MEQEHEKNHDNAGESIKTSDKATKHEVVNQDELTEYRVYEHPLLPKRIVKHGFCWPVLFVGPAYLIYRRLWAAVVIWLVAIVLVRYLVLWMHPNCTSDYIGVCYFFTADLSATVENMTVVAMAIGLLLLGIATNKLWENDLIKRGHIMIKSLRARSMDDALAIIEREKMTR